MSKQYLVQFEGHPYTWSYHPVQQIHVCKNPLVSRRGDTKVALEQGMKAVEKRLQAEFIRTRMYKNQCSYIYNIIPLIKKYKTTTKQDNLV